VRSIAGLHEDHVITTGVEDRFEHAQYFGVAVDHDNLLHWWRGELVRLSHLSNPPFCSPLIQDPCHEGRFVETARLTWFIVRSSTFDIAHSSGNNREIRCKSL